MGIAEGEIIETHAKYEIIKSLGKGNYGAVFLAKQQGVGRHVAMKVLLGDKKKFPDLQQEAWVQGKLSHPNIVSVYDFSIVDEKGYLIMEYVKTSLDKILEGCFLGKKFVPLEFALEIIRGSIEALAHAHVSGVVHGDIKPGNILVNEREEAKLSDFGVATLFGTAAKEKAGSAKWAAPEVLTRFNQDGIWVCDFQSDLFSIGIVGYVLLTGTHPFMDPAGILMPEQVILRDDFVPHPPVRQKEKIPERYVTAIMKLIQRNRKQRYTTAKEALIDLQESAVMKCSDCGLGNPEKANYCSWCGKTLQEETKEGLSPEQEALVEAHELFNNGEHAKGLAVIETFLGSEKNNTRKWCEIGFNYNASAWYKDADIVCTYVLSLDPKLASAYQTRGFAKSNLGQFPEAISDFSKALELTNPDDVRKESQILYQRGYAYMRLNKMPDACKDASESLKLNPGDEKVKWLVSITCKSQA